MLVIPFFPFHGCHAPSLIVKKTSMEISMIINYIEDSYDSVSNQDRYKKKKKIRIDSLLTEPVQEHCFIFIIKVHCMDVTEHNNNIKSTLI